MNLDDFSYEENDRRYINPQVSLDEQNAFIQNLRDTQGERNAQIAQQTHDLGTDVPSNLGGLTGSEAYFNARYQTPQTNSIVADLKSAAQANALNTVLNNELEKAKKRYRDAYRAANNRNSGGGGGDNDGTTEGDIELQSVGNGEEYELRYKRTEGGDDTSQSGGANKSSSVQPGLHLLGPNGERVPLTMRFGNDGTFGGTKRYLETPTLTYEGDKAIREYIKSMEAKGYRLLQRLDSGEVITPMMYWSD